MILIGDKNVFIEQFFRTTWLFDAFLWMSLFKAMEYRNGTFKTIHTRIKLIKFLSFHKRINKPDLYTTSSYCYFTQRWQVDKQLQFYAYLAMYLNNSHLYTLCILRERYETLQNEITASYNILDEFNDIPYTAISI